MAVRSSVVTVGTTPTALVPGGDADGLASRDVILLNSSAVTVYIGGEDVDTATGFPVAAGGSVAFDDARPDSLPFAVVSIGTAQINVLEVKV